MHEVLLNSKLKKWPWTHKVTIGFVFYKKDSKSEPSLEDKAVTIQSATLTGVKFLDLFSLMQHSCADLLEVVKTR